MKIAPLLSPTLIGIMGNPLSHSVSPVMQNAALAALGLDWLYLALPINSNSLKELLKEMDKINCYGFNVTIPHKQVITELITDLSPIAKKVGAVNTLIRQSKASWMGTNTDVEGFIAPLKKQNTNWNQKKAVILGCGGSAKAVVAGLTELQFQSIIIVGRSTIALEHFTNNCRLFSPSVNHITWTNTDEEKKEVSLLEQTLSTADIIINTTPIGMINQLDSTHALNCPLTHWQLDQLKSEVIIYDLIYTPRPTILLQRAADRNYTCIDGLEMLINQGAASLRLWSGIQDIPIEIMRKAALSHILPDSGAK